MVEIKLGKKALQINLNKKEIVQLTGLSLDEIEKIERELEHN